MVSRTCYFKIRITIVVLITLFSLAQVFAEGDRGGATTGGCPVIGKNDMVVFETALNDAKLDSTQTRRTFVFKGKTWFITHEFWQDLTEIGLPRDFRTHIEGIKFVKSEQAGKKKRCFYTTTQVGPFIERFTQDFSMSYFEN